MEISVRLDAHAHKSDCDRDPFGLPILPGDVWPPTDPVQFDALESWMTESEAQREEEEKQIAALCDREREELERTGNGFDLGGEG